MSKNIDLTITAIEQALLRAKEAKVAIDLLGEGKKLSDPCVRKLYGLTAGHLSNAIHFMDSDIELMKLEQELEGFQNNKCNARVVTPVMSKNMMEQFVHGVVTIAEEFASVESQLHNALP